MSPFNTAEVDEDGRPIHVRTSTARNWRRLNGHQATLKPNQDCHRILYDSRPAGAIARGLERAVRDHGIGMARKADIIDIRMKLKDRRRTGKTPRAVCGPQETRIRRESQLGRFGGSPL